MSNVRRSLPALALALVEDPFYQAITVEYAASRDSQLSILERYFEYSLMEAQRTGRCVLDPHDCHGAAAWLLPRSAEVIAVEANAKTLAMADILGPKGSENYHAIVDFMTPLAKRQVPADAWYLSIVGVHPNAQGRGLGRALLQPTLEEASTRSEVCYLETFMQRNVAFYARLGFVTVADHLEPITGSKYVVMRRDA